MSSKKLIVLAVLLHCCYFVQSAVPTLVITDISDVKLAASMNQKDTAKLYVDGSFLKSNIYLTLSGSDTENFILSKDSIAGTSGVISLDSIFVYYQPLTEGQHLAVLTISSIGASSIQYNVVGNALGTLTYPWPTVNDAKKRQISLDGDVITFVATRNEIIEIISTKGTVLYFGKTNADGTNTIPYPDEAIILLRIGAEIYKLAR
jgi:signal peptidase I